MGNATNGPAVRTSGEAGATGSASRRGFRMAAAAYVLWLILLAVLMVMQR